MDTGNCLGNVLDDRASPIAGVMLTISGGGAAPQFQTTDASGAFNFTNLEPGPYSIAARLEGYPTKKYPGLLVEPGRNLRIEITFNLSVD